MSIKTFLSCCKKTEPIIQASALGLGIFIGYAYFIPEIPDEKPDKIPIFADKGDTSTIGYDTGWALPSMPFGFLQNSSIKIIGGLVYFLWHGVIVFIPITLFEIFRRRFFTNIAVNIAQNQMNDIESALINSVNSIINNPKQLRQISGDVARITDNPTPETQNEMIKVMNEFLQKQQKLIKEIKDEISKGKGKKQDEFDLAGDIIMPNRNIVPISGSTNIFTLQRFGEKRETEIKIVNPENIKKITFTKEETEKIKEQQKLAKEERIKYYTQLAIDTNTGEKIPEEKAVEIATEIATEFVNEIDSQEILTEINTLELYFRRMGNVITRFNNIKKIWENMWPILDIIKGNYRQYTEFHNFASITISNFYYYIKDQIDLSLLSEEEKKNLIERLENLVIDNKLLIQTTHINLNIVRANTDYMGVPKAVKQYFLFHVRIYNNKNKENKIDEDSANKLRKEINILKRRLIPMNTRILADRAEQKKDK